MARIPFPNIPKLPGVPAIPRTSVSATSVGVFALNVLQGIAWTTLQTQSRWGIFDKNGSPLGGQSKFSGFLGSIARGAGFGPTFSTMSLDFDTESKISDFPVEGGAFASYNKVESPASPIVTLCMTGNESERHDFLQAMHDASKSIDLYSVVTPEFTYVDYSIERYSYQRRNDRGATLLMVEVVLKEIRQVSAQYATSNRQNQQVDSPKDVGAAKPVDNGKVQPKEPEKSTLKKAAERFGI